MRALRVPIRVALVSVLGYACGAVITWIVVASADVFHFEVAPSYIGWGTAKYFGGPAGAVLAPVAFFSVLRPVPMWKAVVVTVAWTLAFGVVFAIAGGYVGGINGAFLGFLGGVVFLRYRNRGTAQMHTTDQAEEPV